VVCADLHLSLASDQTFKYKSHEQHYRQRLPENNLNASIAFSGRQQAFIAETCEMRHK
jgi:hypothetical protein